jgi:UDP-N-acetylglucosamine 1-carboxyvinyltransferase
VIHGVSHLSGAAVMAMDLRAGAALLLATLAAHGDSVLRRIDHLDRGYEQIETKLTAVGAEIRRVADLPEHIPESLLPTPTKEDVAAVPAPKFLRTPVDAIRHSSGS